LFLATTANHHYWDKNQKVLFLGEWCRVYNQKSIWSKVNHDVLPSPWNDTEQFDKHYSYLQTVQEKYLEFLALNLNKIHGEKHSNRYWRIILGPWLTHFIGTIYDRYLSITKAAETNLITNTWLPPFRQGKWIPQNFESCLGWCSDDNFNLHLIGRIIFQLNNIPYEFKELPPLQSLDSKQVFNKQVGVKSAIKSFLSAISKFIPAHNNRIVVCSLKLKFLDLVKLQVCLGQFPRLREPIVEPNKFSVNEPMRKSLKVSQGENEFENLLEDLMVELMPKTYLEGFNDLRNRAIKAFPKKTKIILSGACHFDDALKIWVADQTSKNTKLILSEIGGGLNTLKFNQFRIHQHETCDKYFTFGHSENKNKKRIFMSQSFLIKASRNLKPNPKGVIIAISSSVYRYNMSIDNSLNNYRAARIVLEQNLFLKKVSPEVFRILYYRLQPKELGWDEKKRLADTFPNLKTYHGPQLLEKQLKKSRLAITFSNSTVFLQTISINFPTILCFNPIRTPLLVSAQPYFNELRRVKIFHDSQESAATWINTIYKNPSSWWASAETQRVRKQFCNEFVRTNPSFYKEWAKEILKATNN
jgi:putative transferase (TIGR04331 family)